MVLGGLGPGCLSPEEVARAGRDAQAAAATGTRACGSDERDDASGHQRLGPTCGGRGRPLQAQRRSWSRPPACRQRTTRRMGCWPGNAAAVERTTQPRVWGCWSSSPTPPTLRDGAALPDPDAADAGVAGARRHGRRWPRAHAAQIEAARAILRPPKTGPAAGVEAGRDTTGEGGLRIRKGRRGAGRRRRKQLRWRPTHRVRTTASAATQAVAGPDCRMGGERTRRGVRIRARLVQWRLGEGDQGGGAACSPVAAMVATR
jgi:hypothetical protein